ncbi:MAG: Gfo/Idh/MocA family oxidoreductase [Planctomycetota bacterium]
MKQKMARRKFLEVGAAASVGMTLAKAATAQEAAASEKPVRLGFIGVGGRGTGLLRLVMSMKGTDAPAVCDINPAAAERAQGIVEQAGRKKPEAYTKGETHYKELVARDDLDAIIIATPWEWHTRMAVDGMKAGKYVGVEVPCAITLDECWDLVKTHEATGAQCMMLENWSFRRDNLAVLNMIRKGLFGEIIHCHCSYSHNCVGWYFDGKGAPRWSGEHMARRNCSQYPTHGLGPVLSWMDINCGDRFDYVVSMATRSLGINRQLAKKFGADHPSAKRTYAQGDVVTTLVKTVKGNTIVVNNDMQTPRPYDNRWEVEGTQGIYNEQREAVFIEGKSAKHGQWEPFAPYQKEYDHAWWRALPADAQAAGHGGTDYVEMQQFLHAVRSKTPTPLDIYDSVAMSAIIPLSEQSIAAGSAPIKCPDFTNGKWQTRKPTFAVET